MARSLRALADRGLTGRCGLSRPVPRRQRVVSAGATIGPESGRGAPTPNEETVVFKGLAAQRLVAVFGAGCALLSFPLLALWDHDLTLLGVPLLPLMLFVVWALLIAVVAWVTERDGD